MGPGYNKEVIFSSALSVLFAPGCRCFFPFDRLVGDFSPALLCPFRPLGAYGKRHLLAICRSVRSGAESGVAGPFA